MGHVATENGHRALRSLRSPYTRQHVTSFLSKFRVTITWIKHFSKVPS